MSEADFVRADSLNRARPGVRVDTLQFHVLQAIKVGDEQRQRELFEAYTKTKNASTSFATYYAIHELNNPEAAARLMQLPAQVERTPEIKQRMEWWYSQVDAELGRMNSAFARADKLPAARRAALIADFALNPFYPVPAERIAAARAFYEGEDTTSTDASGADRLNAHNRLYRLGVLSCRAGDYQAAARYAQQLRAVATPAYWQTSVASLADQIEAQIDIENGRYDEGLRKLEGSKDGVAFEILARFGWGGPAALWRAEALMRAGRHEEAGKWFEELDYLVQPPTPHVAYLLLRKAQVHDARNQAEQARDHYARFLKLMSNPDPELRPVVDQARRRLAELQRRVG